jgi:hypothetical protein
MPMGIRNLMEFAVQPKTLVEFGQSEAVDLFKSGVA